MDGIGDRGQAARLPPLPFDRLLQRQPVHHRRQHADRIGARALDAGFGALDAAKEIAAADDDGDLMSRRRGGREVGGDAGERDGVETMRRRALQGFPGQLDDHTLESSRRREVGHEADLAG